MNSPIIMNELPVASSYLIVLIAHPTTPNLLTSLGTDLLGRTGIATLENFLLLKVWLSIFLLFLHAPAGLFLFLF